MYPLTKLYCKFQTTGQLDYFKVSCWLSKFFYHRSEKCKACKHCEITLKFWLRCRWGSAGGISLHQLCPQVLIFHCCDDAVSAVNLTKICQFCSDQSVSWPANARWFINVESRVKWTCRDTVRLLGPEDFGFFECVQLWLILVYLNYSLANNCLVYRPDLRSQVLIQTVWAATAVRRWFTENAGFLPQTTVI